jgi:large subunit ribosomal protein L21
MSYAILEINSKQFIVNEGDKILIDYVKNGVKNGTLLFKSILYKLEGELGIFGKPYLKNYHAEVVITRECVKQKKIIVFKKKRRKGYHKTIGHRQKYTEVKIINIVKNKGI